MKALKLPEPATLLRFEYVNHAGARGVRHAIPLNVRYGISSWHREPQWFLRAFDKDRGEEREFAMRDMSNVEESA